MKLRNILTPVLWLCICILSCAAPVKQPEHLTIKNEIQAQLDKCVKSVSTKDIDLYMHMIPEDFVVYDENGDTITREQQREYALRDWSIIDTTLNNKYVVDSLRVMGDSAIVYTSQRWERLMFQRDGKTLDTVLTTQAHVETWKKTKQGWLNYHIQELGGEIFINGQPYKQ